MASKDSFYVYRSFFRHYEYIFLLEANTNGTKARVLQVLRKSPITENKYVPVEDFLDIEVSTKHQPLTQEEVEQMSQVAQEIYFKNKQGNLKITRANGPFYLGGELEQVTQMEKYERKVYRKIFAGGVL